MKSVYLDMFSGISGNMFVGALLDAGFPIDILRNKLETLNLGVYKLVDVDVNKCGIRAHYFDVDLEEEHHHEHGGDHVHRHLSDIVEIIKTSRLSENLKTKAISIFTELALAEAKVHGTAVEEVHFHEVGAVDTIIDIVGTLLGLEYLKVDKVYYTSVTTGFGYVDCAHGRMPVPAPATAELLNGVQQQRGSVEKELTTPTGAVLLKCLGTWVPSLPFASKKIVYGAGRMGLSVPNVLRVYVGEDGLEDGLPQNTTGLSDLKNVSVAMQIEANLDDDTGEAVAFTVEELLRNGAMDAWTEPIYMKKGRPAVKLCCLCSAERLQQLCDLVMRHTTTLGLRVHQVEKMALERDTVFVKAPFGEVRVKVGKYGDVVKLKPEFEDCRAVAQKSQLALPFVEQTVRELAAKLYFK